MRADLARILRRLPLASKVRADVDWRWHERQFRRFLARMPAHAPPPGPRPLAVVVQPWLRSPIPWYSVLLAHGIAQRGVPVVIIWDDIEGPRAAGDRMVNRSIGRVLRQLPAPWTVLRLSDMEASPPTVVTDVELTRLADLNTTWRQRGHAWDAGAAAASAALASHFAVVAGAAEAMLKAIDPRAVIVPGGIFSSSGVVRSVAEALGVRVATYDSGEGIVLTAADGVAAWLADIPRALAALDPADDALVFAAAERELAGRRGAPASQSVFGDMFRAEAAATVTGGDVLIPLNQSYDTAALGRHRVFDTQVTWMRETVRWVLGNTSATVVVRRHPVERLAGLRSVDEYGAVLAQEFGSDPRVRYVSETDAVSTYELLRQARVVVPYTSTVGVEATIHGVPVVTESASYYADLGFVWPARTSQEYFTLLARALSGDLVVADAQRHAAMRVYYLTQLCNFLFTDVAPMPADFVKWVRRDPAAVLATPEFRDIVEGLVENVPLAVLRHRRRVHEQPPAGAPA